MTSSHGFGVSKGSTASVYGMGDAMSISGSSFHTHTHSHTRPGSHSRENNNSREGGQRDSSLRGRRIFDNKDRERNKEVDPDLDGEVDPDADFVPPRLAGLQRQHSEQRYPSVGR